MSVAAGSNFSVFIDEVGDVWTCGTNYQGATGEKRTNYKYRPHKITNQGESKMKMVAVGDAFSLLLTQEGTITKLGQGSIKQEEINQLGELKQVAANGDHALFLDAEGNVYVYGNNSHNQLGLLNSKNVGLERIHNLPPIEQISTGPTFTLFLDTQQQVWGCGNNDRFALGERHGNLVKQPVQIEGIPPMHHISAGCSHALFIDKEFQLWGSGSNANQMLFLDKVLANTTQPVKIDNFPGAHYAVAGQNHSLVALSANQGGNQIILVEGTNTYGQIGAASKLEINGSNWKQFGGKIGDVQFISTGANHTLVVDCNEGLCYSSGSNANGQLGIGESDNMYTPYLVENVERIYMPSTYSAKNARKA